jgi:hypothetical protein
MLAFPSQSISMTMAFRTSEGVVQRRLQGHQRRLRSYYIGMRKAFTEACGEARTALPTRRAMYGWPDTKLPLLHGQWQIGRPLAVMVRAMLRDRLSDDVFLELGRRVRRRR